MKVILTENIKSLGSRGDIKDVSDGYAGNYLLPQGKAVIASPENIHSFKASTNKNQEVLSAQEAKYGKIVLTLNKQSINFSGKASDKNILFQGISTSDIIDEVKNKFNLEISANWFVKPTLLKETGKHNVFLRLPNNQLISFFINIKAQ